jgi:hypothetical protein
VLSTKGKRLRAADKKNSDTGRLIRSIQHLILFFCR